MTNDLRSDPMRSLDRVPPPDQWDDIVAAALGPDVMPLPVTGARSRRPRLLVAAAVLVIAGIGATYALAASSRAPVEVTSADGGGSAAPSDDPDGVWGRVWDLQSFTMGGVPVEVPAELLVGAGAGGVPHLDLRQQDDIDFLGCHWVDSAGEVRDGHLWAGTHAWMPRAACILPMPLTTQVFTFLVSHPTIDLRGDRLTLTTLNGVAEFVERRG